MCVILSLLHIKLSDMWLYIIYSSLSVWVKNCDNLELSDNDREKLDEYIDDLYKRIDEADRVYDEDGMEMGKRAISQLWISCGNVCYVVSELTTV